MEDFKEVWELPKSNGGSTLKRSEGRCWINHKRKALQRIIDRYGAYINHLIVLSEDTSLKSVDQTRMKGFVQKWQQARTLISAAMYVDVLKSPSLLSLCLQEIGHGEWNRLPA